MGGDLRCARSGGRREARPRIRGSSSRARSPARARAPRAAPPNGGRTRASSGASGRPASASATTASACPATAARATSSASTTRPRTASSSSSPTPTPSRRRPAPTTTRPGSARSSRSLRGSRPIQPACDVWLIATGAEERPYTGAADHLGALAAVPRVKRRAQRPPLRALARRGRARPHVPPALARRAPAARRRARGHPRRPRRRPLGQGRRHGQLRPPRVRARGPARDEARRPGRPVPAHRVRPAVAASGRGRSRSCAGWWSGC